MKTILMLLLLSSVVIAQSNDSTLSGRGFFSPGDTGSFKKFDTSQHLWFTLEKYKANLELEVDSEQTYFFYFAPKFVVIRGDTVYRRNSATKHRLTN